MRKMTKKEFESREVYKRNELSKLQTTGYEAYRVSPQTTTKYGTKYRKVYGASVTPDYSRPVKGSNNKYGKPTRFGSKVTWFPHGYTSSKIKSGTRLMQPLGSYPVEQKETRSKLMLKSRRRKK